MTPKELKEISREMNTQDSLATACPLYCVFEKEYIYGLDPNYSDRHKWFDGSGEEINLNDESEIIDGIHKVYYIMRERFVNAHFTMKAARQYIRENKHNLNKPFTYVTSLYRCHEMIKIQEYLKSFSGTLEAQNQGSKH